MAKIKIKKFFRFFYISAKKPAYYFLVLFTIGIFLLPRVAFLSSITDENIINLTNQERERAGLSPLTANQLLAKAAYDKAEAIIAAQKFQHEIDGRKFSSWIKDTGYEYSYAGENLAINFFTSEGTMKAWMDSPTHKSNILNDNFREIGVAVVEYQSDKQKAILVVQEFGAPLIETASLPPLTERDGLQLIRISTGSQTMGAAEKITVPGVEAWQLSGPGYSPYEPLSLAQADSIDSLDHSAASRLETNPALYEQSVLNTRWQADSASFGRIISGFLVAGCSRLLEINYIILVLLGFILLTPAVYYYTKNYAINRYTIKTTAKANL